MGQVFGRSRRGRRVLQLCGCGGGAWVAGLSRGEKDNEPSAERETGGGPTSSEPRPTSPPRRARPKANRTGENGGKGERMAAAVSFGPYRGGTTTPALPDQFITTRFSSPLQTTHPTPWPGPLLYRPQSGPLLVLLAARWTRTTPKSGAPSQAPSSHFGFDTLNVERSAQHLAGVLMMFVGKASFYLLLKLLFLSCPLHSVWGGGSCSSASPFPLPPFPLCASRGFALFPPRFSSCLLGCVVCCVLFVRLRATPPRRALCLTPFPPSHPIPTARTTPWPPSFRAGVLPRGFRLVRARGVVFSPLSPHMARAPRVSPQSPLAATTPLRTPPTPPRPPAGHAPHAPLPCRPAWGVARLGGRAPWPFRGKAAG